LLELGQRRLGERFRYSHVASESVPLLYAAADVFVHPALVEGYCLAAVEAMAAGLPSSCTTRRISSGWSETHGNWSTSRGRARFDSVWSLYRGRRGAKQGARRRARLVTLEAGVHRDDEPRPRFQPVKTVILAGARALARAGRRRRAQAAPSRGVPADPLAHHEDLRRIRASRLRDLRRAPQRQLSPLLRRHP